MQNFRKLEVWQHTHNFVLAVYDASTAFPETERYGLTSQLRRAVASIPSNIAEGCRRETNADLRRFLYIALGSLFEVDYQLQLAHDLHFINPTTYNKLNEQLACIRRMMIALIQKLTTHNP